MRLLVTGADGFVGEHVVRSLAQAGHEIIGAVSGAEPQLRTLTPTDAAQVSWHSFDLLDGESVAGLIDAVRPDGVVARVPAQPCVPMIAGTCAFWPPSKTT